MFDCPDSAFVVVMTRTEPKKTIRELVYARVRLGLCINHEGTPTSVDDATWCDCPADNRGVCDKHDKAIRRGLDNLPRVKQAEIISALVYEGQYLHAQQVRDIKQTTSVSSIVRAVRGRAS